MKLNILQKFIVMILCANFIIACSNDEEALSTPTTATAVNDGAQSATFKNRDAATKRAALEQYERDFIQHSREIRAYMEEISRLDDSRKAILLEVKLKPLAEKTSRLLQLYDVSPEEVNDMYGASASSNELILAGVVLLQYESQYQTYASGISWGDIAGCAMEALGLNLFDEVRALAAGAEYVSKKFLIGAIKRLAVRTLGPIGLAITVAEFGWCISR